VTGPTRGRTELVVRMRADGSEWVATTMVPSLRAGESVAARVVSGAAAPALTVARSGGGSPEREEAVPVR